MDDIFNYLIIGVIIYSLLSGFLKKQKPKAEQQNKPQPLPRTSLPTGKSEEENLQIDWSDFFKIDKSEENKTEKEISIYEASYNSTDLIESEKKEDKFKFKEITPIHSLSEEPVESDKYKTSELHSAYTESKEIESVFAHLFVDRDELKKAFLYREIFDHPLALRKKIR